MMPFDLHAVQPSASRSFRGLSEQTAQLAQLLEHEPGSNAALTRDVAQESLTQAQRATQTALLWVFALRCQRAWEGKQPEPAASPAGALRGLTAVLQHIDQRCQEVRAISACVQEIRTLLDHESQDGRSDASSTTTYLAYWIEQLWAQLDRHLRRGRGGYFTPWPLVQYIVRSVDHVLREDMGIAEGLATASDPLRIVDPACGSGAFLLGVLAHLRAGALPVRTADEWESLLRDTMSDRLCGADLLPACGGAAELLLEAESGRAWSALRTNLLEDVETSRRLLEGRIPVILGNPPYANFGRHNRGPWIREQLRHYTQGLGEKKHNLSDDFIKFLRWGQYWIEQAGAGILAMVTSNTYLEGLTHRAMRASLADTFHYIDVLDLHGNRKKRETTPQGARDENVFGIQQGVAIGLFVRVPDRKRLRTPRVRHAELWGSAEHKLQSLQRTEPAAMEWQMLQRDEPGQAFAPRSGTRAVDYCGWPRLDEIFQQHVSGVQTKWDALFVGFTQSELASRMTAFLREAGQGCFPGQTPAWLMRRARDVTYDPTCIRPYMVAPWDVRWVYYEPRLLGRSRVRLLHCLTGDNRALVFMRQCDNPAPYDHLLVTTTLVSDRVFYSAHGAPFVAPLTTGPAGARTANFRPAFLRTLQDRIGLEWFEPGDRSGTFGAHDVLHWIYARLWSPHYRTHYRAELGREFPRVPWPTSAHEFRCVCEAGQALVTLHCQLAADLSADTEDDVSGVCEPDRSGVTQVAGPPRRSAAGAIWLGRTCRWCESIEDEVWQFRLGGYAVLPRWLKQRRGRPLTARDQLRWQQLVQTIRDTQHWLAAIDALLTRAANQSTA